MTERDMHTAVSELQRELLACRNSGRLEPASPGTLATAEEVLPLSAELRALFTAGNPRELSIPWGAERLTLYAVQDLQASQEGYRHAVGAPDKLDADWRDGWVVIGETSGNPVIADTSASGTPVLMAFHGSGGWTPRQVSSSPAEFVQMLARWLWLWRRRNGELWDEDFVMHDDVMNEFTVDVAGHLTAEERAALLGFLA